MAAAGREASWIMMSTIGSSLFHLGDSKMFRIWATFKTSNFEEFEIFVLVGFRTWSQCNGEKCYFLSLTHRTTSLTHIKLQYATIQLTKCVFWWKFFLIFKLPWQILRKIILKSCLNIDIDYLNDIEMALLLLNETKLY